MTRASRVPVVGASHRRPRAHDPNLSWYGVRLAVGTLGRVCAFGLLCAVALNDWRASGLGIVIVGLDELGRP